MEGSGWVVMGETKMKKQIIGIVMILLLLISGCTAQEAPASEDGLTADLEVVDLGFSDDSTDPADPAARSYNYCMAVKNNGNGAAGGVEVEVTLEFDDGTTDHYVPTISAPFILPGDTVYWGEENFYGEEFAGKTLSDIKCELKPSSIIAGEEAVRLNGSTEGLYAENYSIDWNDEGYVFTGDLVNDNDVDYKLVFIVISLKKDGKLVGCLEDGGGGIRANDRYSFEHTVVNPYLGAEYDEMEVHVYGQTNETRTFFGLDPIP